MSAPLEPGTIFAREYRVERPLRSGGMGTVLVVEHIGTGKHRALKLLATELEDSEEMRERFVREARAASAIDSDHVVEIITAGVDEDTHRPYIVMELLQGEDLGDRIERRGPLDHATAALVFRQLGHALGAAHRQGIVHRDLKPENVFLAEGRRPGDEICVKLLDFGVAKILPRGAASQPTQPLGSPLFMSPEQTDADGAIVPSTDVWALGLLAFYLLTGQYFWIASDSCSVPALLREVCFDELPPASVRATVFGARRESLPGGFDAWFAGCVSREAGERFPDGETAANALADLLQRESVVAPAKDRSTPTVPATLDADWFFDDPPVEAPPTEEEPATAWFEAAPSRPEPMEEGHAEPDDPVPPTTASAMEPSPLLASSPSPSPSPSPPAPSAATDKDDPPPATVAIVNSLRKRARPLRNVAIAVAAGCIGGGGCFLLVGDMTMSPPAASSSDVAASAARTEAEHPLVAPPPSRPIRSAPPSSPSAPVSSAPVAAPRVAAGARAWPTRKEDDVCPRNMRFVAVGAIRVCLQITEVTVADWGRCASAHGCPPLGRPTRLAGVRPDAVAAASLACVHEDAEGDLPVNCVDRAAAIAYCEHVDARLPDEEEWLAAARGSSAAPRPYPWGDPPLDAKRANVCDEACVAWSEGAGFLRVSLTKGDDGAATLAPVGSYPSGASPELVLDLAGNVAEWTASDTADGAIVRGSSFASATGRDERRVVNAREASPEVGLRCATDA